MAKDDDLLPEDQPAENLLPEEKMGGAEPAPAAAAPAPAAPAEPPSPIAAELSAKPKSNVWTLLMAVIMVAMLSGIYVHLRELNEIYKVNVPVIGQREGDTSTPDKDTLSPQPETAPDAGAAPAPAADTGTPAPDAKAAAPDAKAAAPDAKAAEPSAPK